MSKLKIISYDDPKTRQEVDSMDVLINPESYNKKIEIKYSDKQPAGTSGKLPKFMICFCKDTRKELKNLTQRIKIYE